MFIYSRDIKEYISIFPFQVTVTITAQYFIGIDPIAPLTPLEETKGCLAILIGLNCNLMLTRCFARRLGGLFPTWPMNVGRAGLVRVYYKSYETGSCLIKESYCCYYRYPFYHWWLLLRHFYIKSGGRWFTKQRNQSLLSHLFAVCHTITNI